MSSADESTPLLSTGKATIEVIRTSDSSKSSGQNGTVTLLQVTPEIHYLPSTTKPQADAPAAILMFAWMGAPIRHMSKFIEYYQKRLVPGTPIILVLSPANQFMLKDEKRRTLMTPAYTTFKSLDISPRDTLVHSFSNGGINALRTFVSLTPTNTFAARAIVVDSAPGISTLRTAINAFTADVKSRFGRFIVSIIICVFYVRDVFWNWIIKRESRTVTLRRFLTESGAIGKDTKRLYLYSDGDELVQSSSVEDHIRDMKELGYNVKSRNFGKTRHVGHMRANPELYWEEVQGIWKN